MLTLLAAALFCTMADQRGLQPSVTSTGGAPAQVQPKKPTGPSILPNFDTSRTTTYAFRSTYTAQQSHGGKEFDPSTEQANWQVRVTPLLVDAEKHEVEIEVEFTGVQVVWSTHGFTERYDSTVAYRPKPEPKPKKPGLDPDGASIDDKPLDRVLYERFKPLHGAKVHLRVSERGEVLELRDEPVLTTTPFASVSPFPLLYSLFVLPATNADPDFTGAVRADQRWTREHVDDAPKEGKAAAVRVADYRVRAASKDRVEVEVVSRFKLPDGTQPPSGYVYDDKTQYVWDPSAGQLASAKLTVTNKSHQMLMGKDHGFSSSSDVTIDRVKNEKRKTPAQPDKPARP